MQKSTRYSLLLCLVCLTAVKSAWAQAVKDKVVTDLQGRVLVSQDYSRVEGYPYLFNEWNKGTVKFASGRTVTGINLKYDVLHDELHFVEPNKDQTLRFAEQVIEFKLDSTAITTQNMDFRSGFNPINGNSNTSYYQVLFDGGASLLKKITKTILEKKVYNSATSTKSFEASETYFLSRKNELVKLKRDKKQILTTLGDHTTELELYLKENNLSVREEVDLIKLITYYNSL